MATVSIGMGLDFPNLDRITHWRPSVDSEQYIQEPVKQEDMACPLWLLCTKYICREDM